MTDIIERFEKGWIAYCSEEWQSAEHLFNDDNTILQIALGYVFMDRTDAFKEEEKAFRIFRNLAEIGNDIALCNLGFCYAFGIGCIPDAKEAFNNYRKSAELGNRRAVNNLAVCYLQASGTEENANEAIRLLESIRDENDGMVLCNLACAYAKTKETEKAEQYFIKAAELGDPKAIRRLERMGHDISFYKSEEPDFAAILFKELESRLLESESL